MKLMIDWQVEWHEVAFQCPACAGKFRARLRDFQRGKSVRCSGGHYLTLSEDGSATRVIEQVERFTR